MTYGNLLEFAKRIGARVLDCESSVNTEKGKDLIMDGEACNAYLELHDGTIKFVKFN